MDWGQIVMIVGLVGGLFGIYWNMNKFIERIKAEGKEKNDWQNEVTNNLKNVMKDLSAVTASLEKNVSGQKDLIEFKITQEMRNDSMKNIIDKIWERIDEHRDEFKFIRSAMAVCSSCTAAAKKIQNQTE